MKIEMTLSEILNKCNDWDAFCDETGISVYACKEGYDQSTYILTEEQAVKHGIIKQ